MSTPLMQPRPQGAAPADRTSFDARKIVYILLAAAAFRFWIMPLGSSLWLDETGTFWTIKEGLGEMFTRVRVWPSITAAYGVVSWAAYRLGGAREWALRLPSVISMALACWLLYRLTRRLFDREAALGALVAFVCSEQVIFAACDARAYALLLACVMGSLLALVEWLHGGARRHQWAFVVLAALAVHVHYLVSPILAVYAIYALARWREGAPVRPGALLAAAAGIAVLLLPLAPAVLRLAANRKLYSYAARPYFGQLAQLLAPPVLVFAAAAGLLVSWWICASLGCRRFTVPVSTLLLLCSLALVPPLVCFAVSTFTSAKVFIDHYMIDSIAAVAMLAGWGIASLEPPLARSLICSSIIVCSVATYGSVGRVWPLHGKEDWRGAMAAVRQAAGDTSTPVLFDSAFIESSRLKLRAHEKPPSYLWGPLLLYPAAGDVIMIPSVLDPKYLEADVLPRLQDRARFVVVTYGMEDRYILWFEGRFPGYTLRKPADFGKVNVTIFQRRQ